MTVSLDDESPRRERIGKQNGKAPRSNKAQNRIFKYVKNKYNLSLDEKRMLHDEITKQGFGMDDIMGIADDISKKP